MGILEEAIARAEAHQHQAAHDSRPVVHVVAGPGTGKSHAIGERIRDLLASGVNAKDIRAVSFTNVATSDLRGDILQICAKSGINASEVVTSTLHALALGLLRKANLLARYPVEPLVLDEYETRDLIDEEFLSEQGCGLSRAREIRRNYEAFSNTGQPPPLHVQPQELVTDVEAQRFRSFLNRRKSVYAAVLPGEIVRECVDQANAGVFDPVATLGIQHLVVDEYQDLNPVDIEFVDLLIHGGITTYVCGDDDQSLYGFRHASPKGIQTFLSRHATASSHTLEDCFRCSPAILDAAIAVIEDHSGVGRLPKSYRSLWKEAIPKVNGVVDIARYKSPQAEGTAIARTAKTLIDAGIRADKIHVLMSNQGAQATELYAAFEAEGVDYAPAREEGALDAPAGRAIYAVLRRIVSETDLVAPRILFRLREGIGPTACRNLVDSVLEGGIAATQVWDVEDASGVFSKHVEGARRHVLHALSHVSSLTGDTPLLEGRLAIARGLEALDVGDAQALWASLTVDLPDGMTIAETLRYHRAASEKERREVLNESVKRLGLAVPENAQGSPAVQFMSMHGSKGLTAEVVFVPGLEDDLLPGAHRAPVPSEVYEAARLLYVAITRARAACLLSYASFRMVNGQWGQRNPSRFLRAIGPATKRDEPMIPTELVGTIIQTAEAMAPTADE